MTPVNAEKHVALYAIVVDGAEIDEELSRRIHEVRVLNYLRLPDMCTLALSFPKAQDGREEPIDQHPFEIGKKLEIRLGERESLTTTTLFNGQILTLEPKFGPGSVDLLVRGFDRSHVLLRSRKVRTFQNQTSTDIVEKIVKEAGLQPECDASGEPHVFMQQDNETDWDFIWRLAERIGFEFVVENRAAHFRKPTAEGAIELQWPETLHSFSPRVTAVQQVKEVTLRAHDPKTKQPIEASVSSPDQIAQIGIERAAVAGVFDGASVDIATEPVGSEAEGKAVAQSLLDKLANGYVAAEGITDGNPKIKAGANVEVSGVGKKFRGTYRVAASTHILRGGSTYVTRFANSPAHTVLGSVGSDRNGARVSFGAQLVLGVVTNNDDPEHMGRVRVRYPALGGATEGAWARIAVPSAGNARGVLMLPVAGEEVLVGFEHEDTTRPYVLGSLFNGVDLPGDDLLADKEGSFAVQSDHKVLLMSNEDMVLKSGTAVSITAGTGVSITGGTEVSIEGATTLTLKCGPSQIQLSSAGVTVSGPMINLG